MKRDGILNRDIARVIASLGHTDRIVVCDAGLPIPRNVERIDLAVTRGTVPFLDVLRPVMRETVVEKIIVAGEITSRSAAMYREIVQLAGTIPIEQVSHEEFKKMTAGALAVIRTGECTPYANVILQSGVNF